MINLSKETINVIKRVADTSKLFDIEVFLIDKQGIRAKSDASYIFLSNRMDLSFLEFDSLCITKIKQFNDRLNLIEKLSSKSSFEASLAVKELDSGEKWGSKLRLITTGTAIEVGCVDGSRHGLPWDINDENMVSFTIDNNSIEVLNGLSRVVQNKNRSINIKGVDGIVVASSADDEGDMATHVLHKNPVFTMENKDFSFIYNMGNILPMMRGKMSIDLTLTERGIMITDINDLKVMIFPEKIT